MVNIVRTVRLDSWTYSGALLQFKLTVNCVVRNVVLATESTFLRYVAMLVQMNKDILEFDCVNVPTKKLSSVAMDLETFAYAAAMLRFCAAAQSRALCFALSSPTSSKISTPMRAGKFMRKCFSSAVIFRNSSSGRVKSERMRRVKYLSCGDLPYLESYLRCERA